MPKVWFVVLYNKLFWRYNVAEKQKYTNDLRVSFNT